MKRLLFFAAATAILLLSDSAATFAQPKGKVKATSAPFTVKNATTRRTISAGGREDVHTDVKITIVWNSKDVPTSMFYRADAAHWLKCKAIRPEKRPFSSGPNDYMVMEVHARFESFKPGQEIGLIPEEFPSDVQPNAVKSMPVGAVYYQMGNSKTWQYVKVKMTKLPDLRQP